jgi:hypothetical protein
MKIYVCAQCGVCRAPCEHWDRFVRDDEKSLPKPNLMATEAIVIPRGHYDYSKLDELWPGGSAQDRPAPSTETRQSLNRLVLMYAAASAGVL